MANQPFWNDLSQETNGATLWSLLVVANVEFFGFVTVTGGLSRDLTVKKAKGADKATVTDNGYKLFEGTLTLKMVTATDWEDFQDRLLPLIHPRKAGGDRTPVILKHPALNVMGVNRVYVRSIGLPDIDSKGIGTIPISIIEWTDKPKTVKKAAGVNPKGQITQPFPGSIGNPTTSLISANPYAFGQPPSEFALDNLPFDNIPDLI